MSQRPNGSLSRKALSILLAGMAVSLGPLTDTTKAADLPDPAGIEYFEKHIRPVLVKQCYSCHSGSVRARGGLRLDTKQGLLTGGESGASVVPGNPEESLLVQALKYQGHQMPPAGKLPDEVISRFEDWIQRGAPDPRNDEVALVARREINFDEARQFWAFQPVTDPAVPDVNNQAWPRTKIDQFILSRLEQANIPPASVTNRATWLRRVSFDLTGLPPSPAQIQAFEQDTSDDAREKVVDRLLQSPQFGERWGRHWLDIARFAESTGKERNFVFAQAWRYRDYVIDSFNRDKPYDQFLREQIAGDLLPYASPQQHNDQIVATGFLGIVPHGINERNREAFLLDLVDEQIDSSSRAILATSIGCARCHDHKFDPIPTTDYYAIAGIFRSSEVKSGILNRTRYGSDLELLARLQATEGTATFPDEAVAELKEMVKQWEETRNELRRQRQATPAPRIAAAQALIAAGNTTNPETGANTTGAGNSTTSEAVVAAADTAVSALAPENDPALALVRIQRELNDLDRRIDEKRRQVAAAAANFLAIGVADRTNPADIAVRIRGEVDKVGPVAPRGFLTALKSDRDPRIPDGHSGRLELAQWLSSRDNPLTARVYVNRIWQKLLGTGLVATVDDFGTQGQKPSHPELLDYLASRFVERGWSIKQAIREIVLSRVYELSEETDPRNIAADGENRLLWRWNRKRLEGEAIRDALLAVSGELNLARPVGTPASELGTRELGPNANYEPLRRPYQFRSVYLPILRGQVPELLSLFDMANPSLVVGAREVTSGPTQALYLLNSSVVLDLADRFAERILKSSATDDSARIDFAYETALGRKPTSGERERAIQFLNEYEKSYRNPLPGGTSPDDTQSRRAAWSAFAQTLFAFPEFRYVF